MRLTVVALAALHAPLALAADVQLPHQGRVLSVTGVPVQADDATVVLTLRGANDALVHTETFSGVDIDDGYYAVIIGSETPLDASAFLSPPLTLHVQVNGQSLGSMPFLSTGHAAASDVTRSVPVQGALTDRSCSSEGAIAWDSVASRLRVCAAGRWTFDGEASVELVDGVRSWSNGSAARSCADYLNPSDSLYSYTGDIGDGVYRIDGDGNGPTAPVDVLCDMTGGGWTRIVYQDYDQPTSGWNNNARSQCGTWGWLHGGYNLFGNTPITTTLSLQSVPHTQLRFTTQFVKVDSWDNETATLTLDGVQRWSASYLYTNGTAQCGNPTYPQYLEEGSAIDVTFAHSADSLAVSFNTNLSSPGIDESWGHDNLSVWIR